MSDSPTINPETDYPQEEMHKYSPVIGYNRSAFPQEPVDSAPIFASPRPYSMPDATLPSYHNQPPSPSMPESSSDMQTDRQIPFYAVPRASSNAAFPGPASQTDYDNTQIPSLGFCSSNALSSSSARITDRPVTPCSNSSSSDSSCSADSVSSYPTSQSSISYPSDKQSSSTSLPSQTDSFSSDISQPRIIEELSRPVSPFRAPQPPPPHQRASRTPLCQPTAIRSYMIPLQDTTSYPPPDPPVILPTENNTIMNQSSFQSQAPYFPFLSHAPPPANSWIEVETLQNEYRLHVRLPGFTREGITLATKRRRILHVVADKWENGGGHFERRISFGYDADLVQVRADFDGLMLRIMIPRRIPPAILHATAQSTTRAVGRT